MDATQCSTCHPEEEETLEDIPELKRIQRVLGIQEGGEGGQ